MDLLEYQAKELFREVGIPVLPSQRIDRPKDLKGLKIPYPVVLKSQVYIGGRGRVGGVKFVENTIDAVAAAQTIFNLPIMGEYPQALLAEAKYAAEQEFYLAVTLNRSIRRPVLLGSRQGGIDVELAIEHMQQVVVDQEFSPFYARRLALKMGLEGKLIQSVAAIIEKMYQLFGQKDLDLVEINPLGVSSSGDVMALDGKVTVNDEALSRHADLSALAAKMINSLTQPVPTLLSHSGRGNDLPILVELDGNISILGNGAGLTMTTMDLVCKAGGKPATCLNIGGETRWDWSPELLCERLERGLELVTQSRQVRVVLINIVSSNIACDRIGKVINNYLQRRGYLASNLGEPRAEGVMPRPIRLPHLVVRLVGNALEQARQPLADTPTTLVERLDDAVAQVVALAKSSKM